MAICSEQGPRPQRSDIYVMLQLGPLGRRVKNDWTQSFVYQSATTRRRECGTGRICHSPESNAKWHNIVLLSWCSYRLQIAVPILSCKMEIISILERSTAHTLDYDTDIPLCRVVMNPNGVCCRNCRLPFRCGRVCNFRRATLTGDTTVSRTQHADKLAKSPSTRNNLPVTSVGMTY